jgi:hypothetical protein
MEAGALLAIIDAATAILEPALKALAAELKAGTITPEQQQARLDKLDALRQAAAFEGPEWEPSPGSN